MEVLHLPWPNPRVATDRAPETRLAPPVEVIIFEHTELKKYITTNLTCVFLPS